MDRAIYLAAQIPWEHPERALRESKLIPSLINPYMNIKMTEI